MKLDNLRTIVTTRYNTGKNWNWKDFKSYILPTLRKTTPQLSTPVPATKKHITNEEHNKQQSTLAATNNNDKPTNRSPRPGIPSVSLSAPPVLSPWVSVWQYLQSPSMQPSVVVSNPTHPGGGGKKELGSAFQMQISSSLVWTSSFKVFSKIAFNVGQFSKNAVK